MCTYSRKKNENFIERAECLCRLCLGNLEDPVPVFNEGKEQFTSLSFRIMLCAGIEITYEENLSNSICKQCHEKVESYYKFRKICQHSYCKLKSHLQALKSKKRVKNDNKDRLKIEENSDDEKLVVNIEDYEPKIERNLNEHNVEETGENQFQNLEDCKKIEIVVEEKIEILQEFNKERVVEAEVNSELPAVPGTVGESAHSPLDISTFLSTILTDLGVIQNHEDRVELAQHGIKSLELETNENLINLEIVEEDQEVTSAPEISESMVENVPSDDTGQDIVIWFAAGNNKLSLKEEIFDLHSDGKQEVENEDDPPCQRRDTVERVRAVCSECSKGFASKSSLRRHLRVHSGERPHACKLCGRRFTQLAILNRHRLTHLETRPFKCDSCEKSFTQRSGLLAHARAHQPPHKRSLHLHKCPQCPKVFLYPSGLSRHMTTHNGRVYICVSCEKHFSDKSSLLRHLKSCKLQPRRRHAEKSPNNT